MESVTAASDIYNVDPVSNVSLCPETRSNVVNNPEIFSVFGDSSCGEPFVAQRLRLDFTPNEAIDNEYVQKKCCAFWDFIKSLPKIQNLMVKPEKPLDIQSVGTYRANPTVVDDKTTETESRIGSDLKERTALSMLEFVEDKGLIDRTFEAKIHESHCTMGSREYRELEKPKKKTRADPCKPCAAPCPCISLDSCPLKTLVKGMQDWDAKNPKSFEQPSHPPSLQHSILQRRAQSTD